MTFKILLSNGGVITEKTVLRNGGGLQLVLDNPAKICRFIYNKWRKDTQSTNFQNWADDLNEDDNFEGTFTEDDALDNLASNNVLNINGKHIDLYSFFKENFQEN